MHLISCILYPVSCILHPSTLILAFPYLALKLRDMITFNFNPFPVIETERLLLRAVNMNDCEAMYFLRSNKEVTKHFNRDPDADMEVTRAKIVEILQNQEKNEAVFWVIAWKENPSTMIGNIGYWRIEAQHHRAEIGYLLHPEHWKKGIMKEALKAVLDYAFNSMKLHSIEANINPDNTASAVLLERCGFVREAYFKENIFHNGVYYDSAIYSKLSGQ